MSSCTTNIRPITETEYIGESLPTINRNFTLLRDAACNIEERINNIANVRTFFYYGPNSATDPYSGMQSGIPSIPSFTTIENFVNNSAQLNLPAITQINDIAYVVYQKTGWFQPQTVYDVRSTGGNVTFTTQENYSYPVTVKIGIGGGKIGRRKGSTRTEWRTGVRDKSVTVPWNTGSIYIADDNLLTAPSFVLFKLTYAGTRYSVNPGFPKFIQGITNSTVDWKNPNFWTTY